MASFVAFVVPEPASWAEFYPPEVGVVWLRGRRHPRVLVVPTLTNAGHLGSLPHGVEVVTLRSRHRYRAPGEVSILVCFPNPELVELAESMRPVAICVADNGSDAVRAWVVKHKPTFLVPGGWEGELPDRGPPDLPDDVQEELRLLIAFDGHNSFLSGAGKIQAVTTLRRIHASHPDLDPAEVEAWLLAQEDVRPGGAERLRVFLEGVRAGRRFLDYRRRPI